jgi:hypothetical protein
MVFSPYFQLKFADTESTLRYSEELTQLARDFVKFAKMYGKMIITESHLEDKFKTIKPVPIGGIAGNIRLFSYSNFLRWRKIYCSWNLL